ncbi:hypothetical protein AAG906_004365 [Vitis piasezkii]
MFNFCAVMQPVNFSNIKCDISVLKGDNYKVWNERIFLHLGCMDVDYAIRKDKSTITDTYTTQSNRLSLMFIKTKISNGIRGSVYQHDNVKALLKVIDEQFVTSDKTLANTLIMKFSSLRLTNVSGVREHIMQMRDIAIQLKTLEVEMFDSFLVHFILNTLPQQYGPFKISYNTHKDKLKMELSESALMAMKGKDHNQAKNKGKGKILPQGGIKKANRYFFCKKKGHMKKDCTKFQKWLEKKGKPISFWIDSVLQSCLNILRYVKPKEANGK